MKDTAAIEQSTYSCPHCGGESFGLVVEDGEVTLIRCHTCDTVIDE